MVSVPLKGAGRKTWVPPTLSLWLGKARGPLACPLWGCSWSRLAQRARPWLFLGSSQGHPGHLTPLRASQGPLTPATISRSRWTRKWAWVGQSPQDGASWRLGLPGQGWMWPGCSQACWATWDQSHRPHPPAGSVDVGSGAPGRSSFPGLSPGLLCCPRRSPHTGLARAGQGPTPARSPSPPLQGATSQATRPGGRPASQGAAACPYRSQWWAAPGASCGS